MPTKREGGLASLEHTMPSQESGHMDAGALEQNLKSHQDETMEEKANRLFNELNAELRKKRSEAKKNGQSEEEIKLIKFDKNSPLYNEWMKAVSKNELDYLDKDLSEIQSKIDSFDEKGERIPDELVKQFQKKVRRISEIKEANTKREEILNSVNNLKKKADKTEQSAKVLGKEGDLAIVEELAMIDGKIGVDEAELSILDVIALGEDSESAELPPPIPTDENELEYFEKLGKFLVDEKAEKPDQKKEVVLGKSRGADKIKDVFYHYLEDDARHNIRSREYLFVNKLNEIVGDDEQFADLLLNDENFKKSVSNFFGANIGVFAFGVEKKAAQFAYTLELARSIYDKAIQQKMVVSEESDESLKAKLDFHKLKFGDWEKYGIETPKQLQARINTLNSDLKIQYDDLLANQDSLAQCSWYQLNKKSLLKDKIKENFSQIETLKELLIDLGGAITSVEGKYNSKDFEIANRELASQLEQLRNEKVGSKGFFDKYTELGVALLAAATVLVAVGESGREKEFKIEKPAASAMKLPGSGTEKMQSEMPSGDVGGMSYASVEKPGMTMAEDMSVQKSDVTPWGGSSEEPVVESGFTSAGELVSDQETKPVVKSVEPKKTSGNNRVKKPKTERFANYDERVAKLEKEISDLIQKQQNPESKPIVFGQNDTYSAKDVKALKSDPNSPQNLQKQIDAKRAELKAYSEGFHLKNVKKEFKMKPIKAESLDFSGVKKLAVLSELASNETLLSGIITAYYQDGLFDAHNTLRTVMNAAQNESDPKELKGLITELNRALRFYKSLDTINHPVNPATAKQFKVGEESTELLIALIHNAARKGERVDLGGIGDNVGPLKNQIEKEANQAMKN